MTAGVGRVERESGSRSSEADAVLSELARRLVWPLEPDAALADQGRFLAQAMTDASFDEIRIVREVLGDDASRAVLVDPPPGEFDKRSWAYWHFKLGFDRIPPQPVRRL